MDDEYITFTMKELVSATGVHRQTIHKYLREGLLPPPCTGAGTRRARYDNTHAELLQLVREQRQAGMSLDAIRRRFERAEFSPQKIRAECGADVPALDGRAAGLVSAQQLGAAAMLPNELRDALLVALGISAEAGGHYDADAAEPLRVARRLLDHGVDEDALLKLSMLARTLATTEATLLAGEVARSPADKHIGNAEERFQLIGQLLARTRLWTLRRVRRRLGEIGRRSLEFARDAIYVPSPLFIQRYDLERVADEVEQAAASGSAVACLRLGRLLLGLGRYAEAEVWLDRARAAAPTSAEALSYVGLTRAIGGSHVDSIKLCEEAVTCAPNSPRARVFLATARALVAVSAAGFDESFATLGDALDIAISSVELTGGDARERMETLLARGRMLTLLPAELLGHAQGLVNLQAVLEATDDPSTGEHHFDFPGSAALYRIHALFYLGMVAQQTGERRRAELLLRECITLDPASRFAQRAYGVLSLGAA